jgi:uncharacterized protein YuzE
MKVTYFRDLDVVQILFNDHAIEDSEEESRGVVLDYDSDGNLVGLEIFDPSKRLDNPRAVDLVVSN